MLLSLAAALVAGTLAAVLVGGLVVLTPSDSRVAGQTHKPDDEPLLGLGSREKTGRQSQQRPAQVETAVEPPPPPAQEVTSSTNKPADPPERPEPTADPVRDALRSVAVVGTPHGHGSGFMAAKHLLVTNYHVIEASRVTDLRIRFPDNPDVRGRAFKGELLAEDPMSDIAVLEVECDVPPLHIDQDYEHRNGQKVVAIGSPGTGAATDDMLVNLTTDGRLGPAYDLPNGTVRWSLAMSVNPGNSGGPILDATHADVVGVVAAKFTKTEAQSLAVPHGVLRSILHKAQDCSDIDRKQAETLHRSRYALSRMAKLLLVTEFSFAKSCEATRAANTDEGKLDIFNDLKSRWSRLLSDEFADFETTVSAEVHGLRDDSRCDRRVRLALVRLHETISKQVVDLRRSISLREVSAFLRDFRESLTRARALARTTAKALQVDIDEEMDE